MVIFKTKLEVICATEFEVAQYYEAAAKKINFLLEKYTVVNAAGKLEKVIAEELKRPLSAEGFFQATPLNAIFFKQKQQFIPDEIIEAYRSIISAAPVNIKVILFNAFLTFLMQNGWCKSLSEYFESQYHVPAASIIILDDIKDFSLGFGVYRITFQLRTPSKEKVVVFLKGSPNINAGNELLYFQLQKAFLITANHAKQPYRLFSEKNMPELLLSPLIIGVASDIFLSLLSRTYKHAKNKDDKFYLKKSLEILIEAFFEHAALGDLLGRNDRNLTNSLIAPIIAGTPQELTLADLTDPEKILGYAKNIAANDAKSIALVDIDLKWLLDEQNAIWSLVDIEFGLSELNLLSLLPEFNDYDAGNTVFFEKRKEYIVYYFNCYWQSQMAILARHQLIFSIIEKSYAANIAAKKIEIFAANIKHYANNKIAVIALFKRFLLDFRVRLVYKEALFSLGKIARESNQLELFHALQESDLLKYVPSLTDFVAEEASVWLQLQCFRGVLSQKDKVVLSQATGVDWETVASNIAMLAEKFNNKLFKELNAKKQFIWQDTATLLEAVPAIIAEKDLSEEQGIFLNP